MDYVEREIVTKDWFEYPTAIFILATACVALGFGLNAYLTGDTGQLTFLGLIPIAIGGIFLTLATESMSPTKREYTSSASIVLFVLILGIASYQPDPTSESIQTVFNATTLAAFVSTLWSAHDWVISWYFHKETPEDRVMND